MSTTHKIVSRWNSEKVLFECEVPADLESGLRTRYVLEKAVSARANLAGAYLADAYLAGANLARANLARANLAGAYLADAYLAGAYLAGAYLAGAKWRDLTIKQPPLQLFGLHWPITILDEHMQIGCELHSLVEWAEFDDARIVEMDGKDALRFWRAHKDVLLALAVSSGRGVTVQEAAQHEAA
jgi:hypothetical protein